MKSHQIDNPNKKIQDICRVVFTIMVINFTVFFFIAMFIGGDALNGHETAGHYYLASHGALTEVSYFVFIYSTIHETSLFITHPLGMIAVIIYVFTGGKRENF
jgi:hypothetical protein